MVVNVRQSCFLLLSASLWCISQSYDDYRHYPSCLTRTWDVSYSPCWPPGCVRLLNDGGEPRTPACERGREKIGVLDCSFIPRVEPSSIPFVTGFKKKRVQPVRGLASLCSAKREIGDAYVSATKHDRPVHISSNNVALCSRRGSEPCVTGTTPLELIRGEDQRYANRWIEPGRECSDRRVAAAKLLVRDTSDPTDLGVAVYCYPKGQTLPESIVDPEEVTDDQSRSQSVPKVVVTPPQGTVQDNKHLGVPQTGHSPDTSVSTYRTSPGLFLFEGERLLLLAVGFGVFLLSICCICLCVGAAAGYALQHYCRKDAAKLLPLDHQVSI